MPATDCGGIELWNWNSWNLEDGGVCHRLFGAVMAVLSLGWHITAWALEGRRVRVVLKHGATGRGGVVLGSVDGSGNPRDLGSLREEGFTGPEVLGITVTNIGRAPVTISRYFSDTGRRRAFVYSRRRSNRARSEVKAMLTRPQTERHSP